MFPRYADVETRERERAAGREWPRGVLDVRLLEARLLVARVLLTRAPETGALGLRVLEAPRVLLVSREVRVMREACFTVELRVALARGARADARGVGCAGTVVRRER